MPVDPAAVGALNRSKSACRIHWEMVVVENRNRRAQDGSRRHATHRERAGDCGKDQRAEEHRRHCPQLLDVCLCHNITVAYGRDRHQRPIHRREIARGLRGRRARHLLALSRTRRADQATAPVHGAAGVIQLKSALVHPVWEPAPSPHSLDPTQHEGSAIGRRQLLATTGARQRVRRDAGDRINVEARPSSSVGQ